MSAAEYTMTINVTSVNDPAYGRPVVRGVEQVGQTLSVYTTVTIGDPDGRPPRSSLNYQWKRYDADGTTWEADVGTGPTYTLTSAESGKKIKLPVSFTDNDGWQEGPLMSSAVPYRDGQTIGEATFASNMAVATTGTTIVAAKTADKTSYPAPIRAATPSPMW